jgi:hypothetical protein
MVMSLAQRLCDFIGSIVKEQQDPSPDPCFRHGTGRKHSETLTGGEYRDRTGDLLVANQALSQLS